VKAGQLIRIPIRDGANIDEDIWGPSAAEFRPERWIEDRGLPESAQLLRAQGNVISFGDGFVNHPLHATYLHLRWDFFRLKVCLGRLFGTHLL
jgi:hypothetical protein